METIKISVIVPVYKVPEEYLRKCIKSILNQSLKELEIILVDDGSPDNCGIICDEYAKKDNRIKVIHKENRGVSSARNIGILKANGEYISFVDSDDWIENDFYEKIYGYAINNNVDIAISGFVRDINGKSQEVLQKEESKIFTRQEAQYKLLERKIYVWSLWDKIYRAKLIKGKILFDKDLSMGEDLDFIWKMLNVSKKIGYISLNKYHYVYRKSSITSNENSEKKIDSVHVLKNILNNIEYKTKNIDINIYMKIKSLYVKELASCCRNLLICSEDKNKYEQLIKKYQKEIRNNLKFGIKERNFSFKIKLGIIYFVFPFCFCKLFNNVLK